MLDMGVIKELHRNLSSQVVLVLMADALVRFCVDFRKVTVVSNFDAYPMPHKLLNW